MLHDNVALPSTTAVARSFMINLTITADKRYEVRSCEVQSEQFRNRTSFGRGATLETAFAPALAREIRACLARLSDRTEVLSLPGFAVQAPGLSLRGVHVMATRLADGATNVILRFLHFLGGINAALAGSLGFSPSPQDERQAIATRILQDIAGPLLNICTSAALDLKETNNALGAFGRKLAANTSEIYFRIDLLRRFLESDGKPQHGTGPYPAIAPVEEAGTAPPIEGQVLSD